MSTMSNWNHTIKIIMFLMRKCVLNFENLVNLWRTLVSLLVVDVAICIAYVLGDRVVHQMGKIGLGPNLETLNYNDKIDYDFELTRLCLNFVSCNVKNVSWFSFTFWNARTVGGILLCIACTQTTRPARRWRLRNNMVKSMPSAQ